METPAPLRKVPGCKALIQLGPLTLQKGKLRPKEVDSSAQHKGWRWGRLEAIELGHWNLYQLRDLGQIASLLWDSIPICKLGMTEGLALWDH